MSGRPRLLPAAPYPFCSAFPAAVTNNPENDGCINAVLLV
jgi:hypothetical protein